MISPEQAPTVTGTPENILLVMEVLKCCFYLGGLRLFKLNFQKSDWSDCQDQDLFKARKEAINLEKLLTFFD